MLVKKYKNTKWLGVVAACVSLEIIERTADELKNLGIPFGFKANLWGVEEPLPVHRFNNAKFNEIGKNALHSFVATFLLVLLGLLAAFAASLIIDKNFFRT